MGERSSRKKAILVTLDELSEGSPKLFFEADFGCLDKVFFVSFFVSFFCLDPLFLFYHQFVFLNYGISYSIHDIKKKRLSLGLAAPLLVYAKRRAVLSGSPWE